MDEKVTVNQLSEEFRLDSKMILGELKKIGVMVFSANQPIDPRLVGKVQAHLKTLSEIREQANKRAEKAKIQAKKVVKPKPRKVEAPVAESAVSKDMKIRKAERVESKEDELQGSVAEEVAFEAHVSVEPVEVHVEETETPEAAPAPVVPEPAPVQHVEEAARPKPPKKEHRPEPEVKVQITPADIQAAAKAAAKAVETPGTIVREIKKEKKKVGKVLKKTGTAGAPAPEAAPHGGSDLFRAADSRRRKGGKKRKKFRGEETVPQATPTPAARGELRHVALPEGLSIKEICDRMEIPVRDMLKALFMKGIMVNINQILDHEVVRDVSLQFGFEVEAVSFEEDLLEAEILETDSGSYSKRAPVVTVMGHVDHGKTSLLDAIRETHVATGEAGGITQHIGAYMAEVKGRAITFIDTPGHEAFTLMRARGAQITDIVVLVVAADDGVMPQTVEAVQHARAAGVPIVVAINKIDKPNANIDRVKHALSELELISEEWGGSTVMVEVSAKKRVNIDHLMEMILLVADIQELKANASTKAMGTVIESRLDKSRGPVATLLVQNGTLFERDIIVAGSIAGKIRAMYDEHNRRIDEAGPSTPVMVLGLENVPEAGEKFFATDDAVKARQLSLYRQQKQREEILRRMNNRVSLDTLFERLQEGQIKELPIILKVDVQGSKDAIESLLNRLSTEKVKINILHSAVGAITENDVLLASASNAIIVGFNVKPVHSAEELAAREGVDIRFYNVIYNISDEIKKAMEGLLEYVSRENVLGTVKVRETFRVPGVGTVIGGYVTHGNVRRDGMARLFRDGVMIYEGRISSLKRFKEDVTEVKEGYECGISLERYNDVKVGDEVQVFVVERVKGTLDS